MKLSNINKLRELSSGTLVTLKYAQLVQFHTIPILLVKLQSANSAFREAERNDHNQKCIISVYKSPRKSLRIGVIDMERSCYL